MFYDVFMVRKSDRNEDNENDALYIIPIISETSETISTADRLKSQNIILLTN
jgi:hypothetical protein